MKKTQAILLCSRRIDAVSIIFFSFQSFCNACKYCISGALQFFYITGIQQNVNRVSPVPIQHPHTIQNGHFYLYIYLQQILLYCFTPIRKVDYIYNDLKIKYINTANDYIFLPKTSFAITKGLITFHLPYTTKY